MRKKRKRARYHIFVDMDGTLYPWKTDATPEELYSEKFYADAEPFPAMIEEMKNWDDGKDIVYICSSYLSPEALKGKNSALDKLGYYIPPERRIFVPYGISKADFIQKQFHRRLDKNMILVDDHTPNLLDWQKANGKGVKVINNMNGHGGRWKGLRISAYTGDVEKRSFDVIDDPETLGRLIHAVYELAMDDLSKAMEGDRVDNTEPMEIVIDVEKFLKSGLYMTDGKEYKENRERRKRKEEIHLGEKLPIPEAI